jgi:4-carboxymuconolactone decarboxylase
MVASQALDCQYVFTVHANLAREAGLPAEAVEAIAEGLIPSGLPDDESTLVTFANQLSRQHRVDDATFSTLLGRVGLKGLMDIVGAIAYFSMIAYPLNAFRVGARAGQAPGLPVDV